MLVICWSIPAFAAEAIVAVASNFTAPARKLAEIFTEETGDQVILVFGSTGKHYAQIKNGAPFAAFLAADKERPALLEAQKVALPGTRFTYAVGRLVLWSSHDDFVDSEGGVLLDAGFNHLAIANPKLAPYGQAAKEVLEGMGLWLELQQRMVRGENTGQAFQFVVSGGAELGFVALSQYRGLDPLEQGSVWLVPAELHHPIDQQAILLADDPVARAWLEFLNSPTAQGIIQSYGYDLPE